MMFRWMVEQIETDFFSYKKDPVLQIYVSGDWFDIPTEVIVNDKRAPDPKFDIPEYPITVK